MVPKNQKARQTRGLALSKAARNRALYMAHEVDGAPGSGSMKLRRRGLKLECSALPCRMQSGQAALSGLPAITVEQ